MAHTPTDHIATAITAPNTPHTTATTITTVQPLPAANTTDSTHSLVLTNDGDGWTGTFGIVLAALLTDLIPEAALEASIAYLDDNDKDTHHNGSIVGFNPANMVITFADGTTIDGHNVLAIGI